MKFGNRFIYKNTLINTIAFSIITFIILEVIIIKEGFQGDGINSPDMATAIMAAINMSDSEFSEFIYRSKNLSTDIGDAILKTTNVNIGRKIRWRAGHIAAVAGVPVLQFIAADKDAEIARKSGATRAQVIAAGQAAAINLGATPTIALLAGEAAAASVFAIAEGGINSPDMAIALAAAINMSFWELNEFIKAKNLSNDISYTLLTRGIRVGSSTRASVAHVAAAFGVTIQQFIAAEEAAEIVVKSGASRAEIIATGKAAAIKVGATPAIALLAAEAAATALIYIYEQLSRFSTPAPPSTPPPSTPALATPSSNSITPPPKDESSNTILILGGITVVLAGGALLYMSIPKA